MMASQADRVVTLEEWEQRWAEEKIGFHQPHVHRMLEKNVEKALAGRSAVRFFFPLCGKAVDMKWLADLGHAVVGVEIAEKAIREFFQENGLSFSVEAVPEPPGAKVYKCSERNISIYNCDLLRFSSSVAGRFGAIWDRGSLVAVNPRERRKYADLLRSLMAPDCRYLLDTVEYNPSLHDGPPFFVSEEQVHQLFGRSCRVEVLQAEDALTDRQRAWGLDFFTEKVLLLSLKSCPQETH